MSELVELCPQCGKEKLALKTIKKYSYLDIFGFTVIVLFISGLLYTGIFGRYSIVLLLAEIYFIVKVLPKFITYKTIMKLSCESCGYSKDE